MVEFYPAWLSGMEVELMACILFVDDDPYTLETLTKAAELFGHRAVLAGSGQEALRSLASEQPDLVFVDMMLPDMDGLQVLEMIASLADEQKPPIYMLSAAAEGNPSEQALALGAQAYLTKPLRLATLLEIVQKHLE